MNLPNKLSVMRVMCIPVIVLLLYLREDGCRIAAGILFILASLTDYLDGDVYYHISRPEQNLDRARTQIRLVEDMERKWERMREIIRPYAEEAVEADA